MIEQGISNAVRNAVHPLIQGQSNAIGKRGTPRVSVWPERKKWEKYGRWWTYLAPDGDVAFVNGIGPVIPQMLQLFYVRLSDDLVLQLAWERPDRTWSPLTNPITGDTFSVERLTL